MPFSVGAMARSASRRKMDRSNRASQVVPVEVDPVAWGSREEGQAESGLARLQRVVRRKVIYTKRLHRAHLAERLIFEDQIVFGTFRLFSQIIIFTLLMEGLRISSKEANKRGIFKNLQQEFEFETLESTVSREEFLSVHLPAIAAKSKDYFILSSKYFDTENTGYVRLLGKMQEFSKPLPAAPIELNGLHEFSFTAWVRANREFNSGYVVRKPLSGAGDGAELSCWGWHLHAHYGPQLHYGGHDFFPTISAAEELRQVELSLPVAEDLEHGEYALHTVVVERTTATFYHNLRALGSVPLPRPLVDCFNAGAGTLVGDTALELGDVRFHPRAITVPVIEELFTAGAKLADIATGSDPYSDEGSEIATAERSITSAITEVEEAVSHRQPLSEIGAVLKAAQEASLVTPTVAKSPDAPVGEMAVNQTLIHDQAISRAYTSLLQGPWTLSQTSDADARFLRGAPSWKGTGVSLSFWYRHVACAAQTCGVYLFTARNPDRAPAELCWSLWIQNNGIWFDNVLAHGQKKYQFPLDFTADKFEINGETVWRHLTMVFDETTDNIRYYIDGVKAWEGAWLSEVANADCAGANQTLTLGRSWPGYTYGQPVEMYDWRMYVHGSDGPLSDEDVRKIAAQRGEAIGDDETCLPITSDQMADTEWTDAFGHSCDFFHEQQAEGHAVCAYPGATEHCPIACQGKQECLTDEEKAPVYFLYDRIQRVDSIGEHGSLCLSDEYDADSIYEQCKRWVEGGVDPEGPIRAWLNSMETGRTGRRIDLRDCEEAARSVHAGCAFNSSVVQQFTSDVVARGGDYSISFWMRPVNANSLHPETKRFYPHMQFLSSLSPPQHNLAFGLWANPHGEVRVFSSCDEGPRDIYENVELKEASNDKWTFVTIVRKNRQQSDAGEPLTRDTTTVTNFGRTREASALDECFYNDTAMFSFLEINYPVLLSPIMMTAQAVPLAELQQEYYRQAGALDVRMGPAQAPDQTGATQPIAVEKKDFVHSSVIMAPPILFVTRNRKSATCPFDYSTEFAREQHARMRDIKCSAPYECSPDLLDGTDFLLSCAGEPEDEARVFGLDPVTLSEQTGYADFLYTVTDGQIVFRDGRMRETRELVDSKTDGVKVILVFFSPELGVTSLMTVAADFSQSLSAHVTVLLQHFEILEGGELTSYVVVNCLIIILLLVTVYEVAYTIYFSAFLRRTRAEPIFRSKIEIFKFLLDALLMVIIVVYVGIKLPLRSDSAAETDAAVGSLTNIQWNNNQIPLGEKTRNFLKYVTDFVGVIEYEDWVDRGGNFVLGFSLLRLILCTSMHPRFALVEGTIAHAFDDLWHTGWLIVLLLCCFGAIATWRFGPYRDDFATLGASMQTQFMMTFGEFPENWGESTDMQVYTVFYFLLVFVLVQNFLLAVIVESFIEVREENLERQTEQELLSDILSSLRAHLKAVRYGWPSPYRLGRLVEGWQAKNSVGYLDLERTNLFRSQEGIGKFLQHYRKYGFLEPTKFSRLGRETKTDTEALAQEIEVRVAKSVGCKVQTLKEFAEENIMLGQRKLELKALAKRESIEESPVATIAAVGIPYEVARPPPAAEQDVDPEDVDRLLESVRTTQLSAEAADEGATVDAADRGQGDASRAPSAELQRSQTVTSEENGARPRPSVERTPSQYPNGNVDLPPTGAQGGVQAQSMLRMWEKVDRLERRTVSLETRIDTRTMSLEAKLDTLIRNFKSFDERTQQQAALPSTAVRRFSGHLAPLPPTADTASDRPQQ